jgi:hypothetical protein
MKQDTTHIHFTISKILLRDQLIGPKLYEIYATVPTIHTSDMRLKQSKIVKPICYLSEKHIVPTKDGFKKAPDLKEGDVILCTINCLVT